MTSVIVNDASCLIDLHKVRLLPAMLRLPHRFVVPLPIRRAEALDLTDQDWRRLDDAAAPGRFCGGRPSARPALVDPDFTERAALAGPPVPLFAILWSPYATLARMSTETKWIIGTGVALAGLLLNQFATVNGRITDLRDTFSNQLATQNTELLSIQAWTREHLTDHSGTGLDTDQQASVADVQLTSGSGPDLLLNLEEHGDSNELTDRGIEFYLGQGVPQDYGEAVRWFRRAADQGNVTAQNNLGVMYANGQGVPQDYAQAARWYRRAAEGGSATAQNNLGNVYATGRGVAQDDEEAARWFRLAGDQGDAVAQNNLGSMYDHGRGVPQDYGEAVRWFRRAADQGNAKAQSNLGIMHAHGRGVPQNYEEAVEWFRRAADKGHTEAQSSLGVLYATGRGVQQDYEEAVKWYRLAADKGDAAALNNLGGMYAYGRGVEQDYREAVRWFRRAADQGDASAQNNLGILYSEGQGVPTDYVSAHKWLNLAAAQGHEDARQRRDAIAAEMTTEQVLEAQRAARDTLSIAQ